MHNFTNSSVTRDDTTVAKSVAMCVLFTASLSLGTIPVCLRRIFKGNAKKNPYVQKLLCLGGGVLLCTTFIHLLPEVSEKIRDIKSVSSEEIHYAELLMCLGFFTMYFVEECVHSCLHHKEENALVRTLSIRSIDTEKKKDRNGPISVCEEDRSHSHGHSHFMAEPNSTVATVRGLFIVLALSVHELFEGLAVGLESSNKNVWYMFGAVSAHKLVIAFCIGVELVTSGMRVRLVVLYVFIFAVVSPLGIGMGILVTSDGESATAVPSIFLQGLASGTLLYVVFFEILREERKSGLWQFFAVLLGFLIMLGIKFLQH